MAAAVKIATWMYRAERIGVLRPGRFPDAEESARPREQDGEQHRDRDRVLVRGGQERDAERLEHADDEARRHRGEAVPEPAQDRHREALDGEAGADVVLRVR